MENPYLTGVRHDHQVLITLVLLALLGAVFLEGFLQAIGVAVALAGVYLALNVVVVITRLWHVLTAEHVVTGWPSAPTAQHSGVLVMVGAALLVFVCTLLGFLVTWISDAGIDRQRGAYATGVLVLISSAAIAVTISAHQRGRRAWTAVFAVISTVFLYTTAANVVERPDGVRIGGCFIAGIIPVSPLSRLARAVELRVTGVTLDPLAERFVRDIASRTIRFVAHVPGHRDRAACHDEIERIRDDNGLPGTEDCVFVEVTVTDPSEFETGLCVHGGVVHDRYRVLSLESTSIPNALAALLLYVRDTTGSIPHVYFRGPRATPSTMSCASSSSAGRGRNRRPAGAARGRAGPGPTAPCAHRLIPARPRCRSAAPDHPKTGPFEGGPRPAGGRDVHPHRMRAMPAPSHRQYPRQPHEADVPRWTS